MLRGELLHVDESQTGKGGENKNITDYGDSLQRKFLVVDGLQFIHSKKLTDHFFFVELDADKRVFCYPFIGQCQIGNLLQTLHITDDGILLTFLFRLQIKFEGTYQLTVDFRQRQIILFVFLADMFCQIAFAAFITANGNLGVVFPYKGTALVIVFLHGADEGTDRSRFYVQSEKYIL